jgi:hypothetical protein
MTWKLHEIQISCTLTHLYVVYGGFHAAMAELSGYNRDIMPTKPEAFTIWPFT